MSIPRASERPPSGVTSGVTLQYVLHEPQAGVTRLAWSPDGRSLAVPTRDGWVGIYDAPTGLLRLTMPREREAVMGVAWSPDSRRLATISSARGTTIRDAGSGRLLDRAPASGTALTGVAWSPCGTRLAVTAEDGRGFVRLFDVTGRTMRQVVSVPLPGALHVAWNPEGTILAIGTRNGTVHRWDVQREILIDSERHHRDAVVHVAWARSAAGEVLASASKDGTIGIRDPGPDGGRRVLTAHQDHVIAVAFDTTGTLLASKSRDGTVRLWNVGLWHVVAMIHEPTADVGWSVGLAFHPGGRLLATLGVFDGVVRVWELDRAGMPSTPLEMRVQEALVQRPRSLFSNVEPGRRRVRLR